MEPAPGRRPSGLDGIRELASRESAEIVLEAAARIERLIAEAEAELRVLKGTIDAAASPESGPANIASPGTAAAPLLPVSASARHALDKALSQLDRFGGELAASSGAATRFRVRRGRVLPWTAGLLFVAGILGLATGWLAMPRSGAAMDVADSVPSAAPSPGASDAMTAAAPGTPAGRPEAEELRERGSTWLRAYLGGRTVAADPALGAPIVRDERAPSERLSVSAARRTITPARVDVFGDAAVLSASVTERSTDGRELVSLVSQLWTRMDGRWQLDDVRIVSAAGAEQAFRR